MENIRKNEDNQVLYNLVESEHFKNYNISYSVFCVETEVERYFLIFDFVFKGFLIIFFINEIGFSIS